MGPGSPSADQVLPPASTRPTWIDRVRGTGRLGRMARYTAVSGITLPLGQGLLLFCLYVLDMGGVASNIVSVSISSIPAYLIYRKWVWSKEGDHSLWGEVVPFWGMALFGLIASTLAVAWAENRWHSKLAINAANLAAFGIVWVIKYFVLDKVLFGRARHPHV